MKILDWVLSPPTKLRLRAERRWRLLMIGAVTPALFAILLWMFASLNREPDYRLGYLVYILVHNSPVLVITLSFASMLIVLFLYLQTGLSRDAFVQGYVRRYREQRTLQSVAATVQPEPPVAQSPSDPAIDAERAETSRPRPTDGESAAPKPSPSPTQPLADLISDIKAQVIEAATAGFMEQMTRLGEQLDDARQVRELDQRTSATLARTNTAIDSAGWRANVNLLIGFAVTTSGIGTLLWFIARQPTIPAQEVGQFLGYYAPRVGIVALIELFAYFFLQLYKSGLQDIKYYNNEMTNVESQFRALWIALATDDTEAKTHILKVCAATDRNNVAVGSNVNAGKVDLSQAV